MIAAIAAAEPNSSWCQATFVAFRGEVGVQPDDTRVTFFVDASLEGVYDFFYGELTGSGWGRADLEADLGGDNVGFDEDNGGGGNNRGDDDDDTS